MNPVEIILVAVALGCDALAVGLAVGAQCSSPRQVFRLTFHFGWFQFMMPVLGWLLGRRLSEFASTWAPWVAALLLLFIGCKMIRESFDGPSQRVRRGDPTRGFSLVALSVATSIDALGFGIGLGLLNRDLFLAALCIGITASCMTWMGMKLGNRLSLLFGRRLGIAGGVVLILIAVKLMLTGAGAV